MRFKEILLGLVACGCVTTATSSFAADVSRPHRTTAVFGRFVSSVVPEISFAISWLNEMPNGVVDVASSGESVHAQIVRVADLAKELDVFIASPPITRDDMRGLAFNGGAIAEISILYDGRPAVFKKRFGLVDLQEREFGPAVKSLLAVLRSGSTDLAIRERLAMHSRVAGFDEPIIMDLEKGIITVVLVAEGAARVMSALDEGTVGGQSWLIDFGKSVDGPLPAQTLSAFVDLVVRRKLVIKSTAQLGAFFADNGIPKAQIQVAADRVNPIALEPELYLVDVGSGR
jgi:hypothetical protein